MVWANVELFNQAARAKLAAITDPFSTTEVLAFNSSTSSPQLIRTMPAGTLIKNVLVIIDAQFDGDRVMGVGFPSNHEELIAEAEADLQKGNIYEKLHYRVSVTEENVTAYLSGASTVGSGRVIIEYLLP